MLFFLEAIENDADREKVLILYESYHRQLYYLAYSKIQNEELAEDMVHETYIAVIKHLEDIDESVYEQLKRYQNAREKQANLQIADFAMEQDAKLCLKTWNFLATILRNKIIDWQRRMKKTIELMAEGVYESEEVVAPDCLEGNYIKKEKNQTLNEVLSELESPFKEVLLLKYYNGISTEEIGNLLGKSSDNIRQILNRGRKRLKEKMKERGYHES